MQIKLSDTKAGARYIDELKPYHYKYLIYKLSFENGKVYIGQTKDLKRRLYSYLSKDSNRNHLVKKAILKYGFNTVLFEIVEVCESPEYLNEREKYYILKLDSYKREKGYNLEMGGFEGMPSPQTILKKIESSRKVQVGCYDLEGNLLNVYISVREAARKLSILDCEIHKACKLRGVSKGYLFCKSLAQKIDILPESNRRGKSRITEYVLTDKDGKKLFINGHEKVAEFLGCTRAYVSNLLAKGNYYNKMYKVKRNVS